jgi:hypothetical protein
MIGTSALNNLHSFAPRKATLQELEEQEAMAMAKLAWLEQRRLEEEEEEEEDEEDNSFPAKLFSIIQSMPMHDHHEDDEGEVIDCAKAYVKEQLLALACPTYRGFDKEFEEDMPGYCSAFRQLCYITSDHYDEAIDIDGYQIDLLEVDDVMLSQDTRTLLEEEQQRQEPNFYGELEAGPYRGNAEDSDGWMETRKIRESAAREELIRHVEELAERLPEYISSNAYTGIF